MHDCDPIRHVLSAACVATSGAANVDVNHANPSPPAWSPRTFSDSRAGIVHKHIKSAKVATVFRPPLTASVSAASLGSRQPFRHRVHRLTTAEGALASFA